MFCFIGIPLLAITGTADKATQKNIVQLLAMSKNMVNIFVSPNRVNLKFFVSKVKKCMLMDQMSWLVNEVKEKGPKTPQTIICCSLKDIATIVNLFYDNLACKFNHNDMRALYIYQKHRVLDNLLSIQRKC